MILLNGGSVMDSFANKVNDMGVILQGEGILTKYSVN